MEGKKILIISDSIIEHSTLKDILEKEYVIYEASNENSAIDFLHSSYDLIDLILIDITMPTINVRQFLKLIILDEELKAIPIVALCNKDEKDTEIYALSSGAIDVIYKPYDKDIVLLKINNIFKKLDPSRAKQNAKFYTEQEEVKKRLQGIMDNMDGGVAIVEILSDEESKLLYLNNGFSEMFYYSKDELESKGNNFIGSYLFEKANELFDKIGRSIITKEKFSIDTLAYCKNKHEIYVQILGTVLANQKSAFPVVLLILNDITNLKNYETKILQANEKLKYRANYDALTNIYNRSAFIEETRRILQENVNTEYAIIQFNFDKFKLLNELLGTDVGDKILQKFALYLKEVFPKVTYGRLESDHFACLVEASMLDEGKTTKQLNELFDDLHLNRKILIHAGVYVIKDKSIDVTQLLDRANMALNESESNILSIFNYFDDRMHTNLLEEQILVSEMQRALDNHEYVIHLQPIYSVDKRAITKAEALVRWQHPQRGLLYPGKFIPAFEKNGFITKLDTYVWEEACRYIRSRIDRGLPLINISVNISRINIYRNDLADVIYNLTRKYDISPSMLDLEITESVYSSNSELLIQTINKLKEKGFTVLMDDFGAGYSSLNALKDLNFDILKIDMKFLEDFQSSRKSASILTAVIQMAKLINMGVVAEGVEDVEQFQFLTNLGCNMIQGYLFSKPLPIEEFERKTLKFIPNLDISPNNNANEFKFLYDNNEYIDKTLDLVYGAFAILELSNDNLKIIKINNAYSDMLGYSQYDASTKYANLFNILQEESKKDLLLELKNIINTKKYYHTNIGCFNKNGDILYLDTYFHYLSTNNDKSLFAMETIDKEIQVENNNLDAIKNKSLLEVIPAKLIFASLPINYKNFNELKVIYINNDSISFNGYTNDEYENYIKKDMYYFIHPNDKRKVEEALENFKKTRHDVKIYYRIKIKDSDDYKWIVLYVKVATITSDTIYFSFALLDMFNIKDMSRLHDVDGKDKYLERYIKKLYDDYPGMILQLSFSDGKFEPVLANKDLCNALKIKDTKIFRAKFEENPFFFIDEEEKVQSCKIFSNVLESGIPHTHTQKFYISSIDYILVNVNTYRIMNIDGNYILHIVLEKEDDDAKKSIDNEITKFVSMFGETYNAIYKLDVCNDSYTILKSFMGRTNDEGIGFKKLMNKYIQNHVFNEDIDDALSVVTQLFENNPSLKKLRKQFRIYHNNKINYILLNIVRISKNIFLLGYNIMKDDELTLEMFNIKNNPSDVLYLDVLYKEVMENLGINVIMFSNKHTYVSPSLVKYNISKCNNFEELKQNCENIVFSDDALIFNEFLNRVERNGLADVEVRLVQENGSYCYNHLAFAKKKINDDENIIYGYIRDINLQMMTKQIEIAKQKYVNDKNSALNALMLNLPVGVGIYELEDNKIYTVYVNNILSNILRVPISKIDESIKKHLPNEEIKPNEKAKILKYVDTNKTYNYQKWIKIYDGSMKWVNVAAIFKSDNKKIKIYTAVLDISESIISDMQIERRNKYLKELLSNVSSIYYEYDMKNDILRYYTLVDNSFKSYEINNYMSYISNSKVIHNNYVNAFYEMYDKIKNQKIKKGKFESLIKITNTYQWYRIECNVHFDNNEDPSLVSGLMTNIDNEVIMRKQYDSIIEKDPLSGLLNRKYAESYISSKLKAENEKYAFMMMDIDMFKSLNDNFGHPLGDKTIKHIASALEDTFKNKKAIISRFGGDEFVVFYNYNDESEIENAVNELFNHIYKISSELSLPRVITMSVGIALAPKDALEFEDLFTKADKALYLAKTSGKNRMCWYNNTNN